MKILVILSNDVYNFPTVNIVKEMLRRDYQLELYAMRMEYQHVRMFDGLGIEIKNFWDISPDDVDGFDFIYSASTIPGLPMEWWKVRKYIFHFTTTPYDEPGGYGDYTFTQRDMNVTLIDDDPSIERVKALKATPGKVTGNPKYDISDEDIIENKKQILYVDASHSPDGIVGRMCEAKMILDIACHFPEYKIVIKPRYFKTDTAIVHRNEVFLSDCLNSIVGDMMPENVVLLREHTDLEEIAKRSEIIITSGNTSSYCSIGAYGKKGIIAGELPMMYHRWEYHSKLFRSISYKSGLMIPFDKVVDALPYGKRFDKKNLYEMGLDIHDSSKRIVDEMEQIYNNYIAHGIYPSNITDEENITMDEVVVLRYIKSLFGKMEELKMDIPQTDFSDVDKFVIEMLMNRDDSVLRRYSEYTEFIENRVRDIVVKQYHCERATYLEQEYYLFSMMKLGRSKEVIEESFDAEEMYDYIKGRYEIEKNNFQAAIQFLSKYIHLVSNSSYEKSYAYQTSFKESAYYWLGYCYYQNKSYENAIQNFFFCEEIANHKHIKAREYTKMSLKKISA